MQRSAAALDPAGSSTVTGRADRSVHRTYSRVWVLRVDCSIEVRARRLCGTVQIPRDPVDCGRETPDEADPARPGEAVAEELRS